MQALQDQIRTYLGTSPTELALAAQVVQWHQETGLSARDIGTLVTLVQAELEQTEERDDSPIGEATPTPS